MKYGHLKNCVLQDLPTAPFINIFFKCCSHYSKKKSLKNPWCCRVFSDPPKMADIIKAERREDTGTVSQILKINTYMNSLDFKIILHKK